MRVFTRASARVVRAVAYSFQPKPAVFPGASFAPPRPIHYFLTTHTACFADPRKVLIGMVVVKC